MLIFPFWPDNFISLSLSPVRVRDYGPTRDTGWQHYYTWLQTKVGSAKLCIKSFRSEPQGSFTCNMPPFLIAEEFSRKNCQGVIPTCWWTATFPLRHTSEIRLPVRQRIPGNGFSRPCFRRSCNPMCKSKLWSEESIFPVLHWEQNVCNRHSVIHLRHNVSPVLVIMNSNRPNYRTKHAPLHDTKFLQANLCQWQGCKSEKHSRRHHCVK